MSIKQFVREAMQCCLQLEDIMPLVDEPREGHVRSFIHHQLALTSHAGS